MQPSSFIVPLFCIVDGEPTFLGTAFFVRHARNILLTAAHVVRDRGADFVFSAVVQSTLQDGVMPWFDCNVLHIFYDIDLAVLTTSSYFPNDKIELPSDDEVQLNRFVVCHEYSDTRKSGKDTLQSQAASRIGNVTRMLDRTDILGKAGSDVLELSFPALRGASGAPVITMDSKVLFGVVLQNVQYELLPIQIETVLDEKNQILEETKYMLPQALALHVKHVRAALNSIV